MKNTIKLALLAATAAVAMNAQAAGNIEAGKAAAQKYNCFTCHGQDYNTPIDPTYPKLAGQHQDYLAQAMLSYQRGGSYGRSNAIMAAQVKPLNKKEIQDIAAYLSSLKSTLVVRR